MIPNPLEQTRIECYDCGNTNDFSIALYGHNHGTPIAEQHDCDMIYKKCGSYNNNFNLDNIQSERDAKLKRLNSNE